LDEPQAASEPIPGARREANEDGLMYGDGFVCLRCGNCEAVGVAEGPDTSPVVLDGCDSV
jgi:hypothetical protein